METNSNKNRARQNGLIKRCGGERRRTEPFALVTFDCNGDIVYISVVILCCYGDCVSKEIQ